MQNFSRRPTVHPTCKASMNHPQHPTDPHDVPLFQFALRADLEGELQFLPTRGEPHAQGWDVRAAPGDRQPIVLHPFEYAMIPLGVRAFCPDGWGFDLRPRSSSFVRRHLNSLTGTIDQMWEGELVYCCQYLPVAGSKAHHDMKTRTLTINWGDAIGQILPLRRPEMTVVRISNEEFDARCAERGGQRGTGGFGSTSESLKSLMGLLVPTWEDLACMASGKDANGVAIMPDSIVIGGPQRPKGRIG